MQRRCFDCGATLARSLADHAYRYDHGAPIQLRAIVRWSCACGYYEVEIPRMGPLHRTIEQALQAPDVKREDLALLFEEGSRGIEDGTWSVIEARQPSEAP